MAYFVFKKNENVKRIAYANDVLADISESKESIVVTSHGLVCEIIPTDTYVFNAIQIGPFDLLKRLNTKIRINIKHINLYDIYDQSQKLNNVPEHFDSQIDHRYTTATVQTNINNDKSRLVAVRKMKNEYISQNGMKKFIYDLINPIISFQTFVQNNISKIKEFNEFIAYVNNTNFRKIWDEHTVYYSAFSNFKTFVTSLNFNFIKNFIETNQIEKYYNQLNKMRDLLGTIKVKINVNLKGVKFFSQNQKDHIKIGNANFKSQRGITNEIIIAHLVSQNILDKFQVQLERLKLLSN